MAQSIYIDGVDRAYTVSLFEGEEVTSSAETGAVNVGRIEIDDPDGSLDIPPLKAAYIVEDDAPSGNQRVWMGYLFNLTIDRGPYRSGAGRVWHADCVDVNFDLSRRFFISANAFRPAETDVARLDWILNGNLATVDLVFQGSLTNLTDNVKNLDADDLRYVTPMEALANIAPQCGKRAFAFYNETTDKVELFYDLADAAVNTSSAKISNDLDDAGSGVYYPYLDASLDRKGEEIASTWILNYVGGHERQDRADTLATYGEHWFTSESSRIGRATTAASWVAQTLAAHDHPEDTVTVTIETETANVNDIKEGQRLQVKFTHLPDLDSFVYRRVISRVLRRIPGGRLGKYLVQLILDNNAGTALGGGGTGGFPHQEGCGEPAIVQVAGDAATFNAYAVMAAGTVGNTWVAITARAGSISAPFSPDAGTPGDTAWTTPVNEINSFNQGTVIGFKPVEVSDPTTWHLGGGGDVMIIVAEIEGLWTLDTSAELDSSDPAPASATVAGATVTPTAGASALIVGAFGWRTGGSMDTSPTLTAPAPWVLDLQEMIAVNVIAMVHQYVAAASGTYTPEVTTAGYPYSADSHDYGAQTLVLIRTSGCEPPMPGQWVYGEVVTMSGADGTTAFPFATGSLTVFVDLTDQTSKLVSQDGTTGDFTLGFTPTPTEVVTVQYQGR